MHTALGEYKKAKEQGKISKFFFNRNIDEYLAHVKSVEEKESISYVMVIIPLSLWLLGCLMSGGSGKTHQLKLIKQNIKLSLFTYDYLFLYIKLKSYLFLIL